MHPQPCAQKGVARPRTSIHSGGTGKPGNPARNGVTAYAVLSSGRCSIAPVLPRKMVCHTRLGGRASARNTPASGAGPHGLPVRFSIVRPARPSSAHRLNLMAACPANSDHARYRRVHRISSRVCDDRETPLVWDETNAGMRCFEQKGNRNIFGYGAGQPRNTR